MAKWNATQGARLVLLITFLLVGLLTLAQQEYLSAAIWLCIGGGLSLSITDTPATWYERPRGQRVLAVLLIVVSLVLFVTQVVIDFRA